MTLTDRQRDDLVSVCHHESAHGWAAHAHGVPRDAIILFAYVRPEGISGRYSLKAPITDPDARIQVALAGKIAQVRHHQPDIIDDADQIFDRLTSGAWPMTPGDAKMAAGFDQYDVQQTVALVRRFWPRIEWTAGALVRHTVDRIGLG